MGRGGSLGMVLHGVVVVSAGNTLSEGVQHVVGLTNSWEREENNSINWTNSTFALSDLWHYNKRTKHIKHKHAMLSVVVSFSA